MMATGILAGGCRPVFGSAHEGQAGYGVAPQSWDYVARPLRRYLSGGDGGDLDRRLALAVDGPLPDCEGPLAGRRVGTLRMEGRLRLFSVDHVTSFAPGLIVRTPSGLRRVDSLRAGDSVLTLDRGPQKLLWTGRRRSDCTGISAPILLRPGALGNRETLLLSPSQKLVLRDRAIRMLFGRDEAVISVRHLLDGDRILRSPRAAEDLVLLMFEGAQALDLGAFGLDCAAPVCLWELAEDELARVARQADEPGSRDLGEQVARGLRIGLTGYESRLLQAMISAGDLLPGAGRRSSVPVG